MSARLPWSGRAAAALAGLAATALAGADDGGYFPRTWTPLTVLFASLGGIALVLRGPVPGRRIGYLMAALLALFALWELASATWGTTGTAAADEARRTLVYVVALVALLLVVDSGATEALLAGAVVGVVGLSAYGLAYKLLAAHADTYEGRALFEPTGYANAQGILAVMGILLALGLAARRTGRSRLAAVVAAAFLASALVLTDSRGAWVALAVAGGAVLLIRRVPLVALAAGASAAAVAIVLLHPGFAGGDRVAYWRAAAHDVRRHPLLGSGAGSFAAVWEHEAARAGGPRAFLPARDAHNVYLETLAETGPVGLALLLGALALPFAALRARRGPVALGVAAAYTAFLVHAALDWDWELPVVILTALVCSTALVLECRPGVESPLAAP